MAPSYDEAHPVVYANCLACQKRGHALWFPEGPDGSDEVQVGDVGYINRDGKFLFLFNIEEKANTSPTRGMRRFLSSKPCNFFDFENPDVIITTTADELQPNVYTSKSMTKRDIAGKVGGGVATIAGAGVKVEYSVGEDQGAACWLPEPGAQRQVESSTLLRQYVKDNLEDWYEEIKKRQHIKLEDLVVVNGTIKSPQYKVTAVISAQKSRMAEFNANAMNVVDLGLHIRLVNHGPPRAEQRQLLFDDGERPNPVKALSIFLRYYKMKQRLFRKKIEANAGPHVLPPGEDPSEHPPVPADNAILVDERDSEVEGARPYLPVDALLDYILEACPEAEHALACDEDVYSLFLGEELPDDVISALRQKEPRIVIDERKVGSLVLEDVIRRERVHKITGRAPSSLLTDDDDLGEPPLRDATVTFRDSAGNEKTIEWPHQHLSDKAQQQGSLKATSISPDGKIIAVGFDDASIILWELATSTVVKHLSGHEDGVYALAFSPNGTKLASGSADMKIIVWSVIADKDDDGNDIEDNDFPILEGHELDVTKVAYSPDGTRLVSGALDGVLKIWDATQGYALLRTINNVTSPQWVSYTLDSRKIVATMDHNVCVWNPVNGAKLVEMRGHEANIYMVDFSHDGTRIATASEDQTARVWNLETGEELLTLHEHSAPIWCVAFSKDDNEVATGSDDTTIVIADSWTGQRRAVITDHGGLVNTLAYSKSGDWLCSGTMEGNVRLLDARSGTFVAEYQGHADKIRSVAFSPEADAIITSSEDGTIRTFSATDILRMR